MTPLAQQQITVEKEEVKGMSQPKNTLHTAKSNVKLPFYFKHLFMLRNFFTSRFDLDIPLNRNCEYHYRFIQITSIMVFFQEFQSY